MHGNRHHTIIGNSAAALAAIRAIRASGDQGPIVLVSAENCRAYSPVLTTYYIGGRIQRDALFIVDRDFYRRHRVRTILGRRVTAVDPVGQRIHLEDRTRLAYDRLLIASGAAARQLESVDPQARPFVHTLRTIDDADRIRAAAQTARRIVAVGAGLVSLQTIKAVLPRGAHLSVVVGSEQLLSQQMDGECAALVRMKLARSGVDILFGRGVAKVEARSGGACVLTSYGESLPADLVVVGKGVRPNMEMVAQTGIRTGYGIHVDARMRTSAEHVFAAGDVAEGINTVSGVREVIATWFNATAQGRVAGFNMAGKAVIIPAQLRENVTSVMGLEVVSIGETRGGRKGVHEMGRVDAKRGWARKFYLQGERLVGALLIGKIHDAGTLRHCVANGIDVRPWLDRIATTPLDFSEVLVRSGGAVVGAGN